MDVSQDQKDTHPPSFCSTCYVKIGQYTKGEEHVRSVLVVQRWSPHTEGEGCQICQMFAGQQRGVRPRKERKNWGRPGQSSNRVLADKIVQQSPPSWRASHLLTSSRFLPPASSLSLQDLQCTICNALWIS